jgi:formylglycine-generating enzyme required for sulfatase activity/dienelactone hydrolase
MVDEPEGTVSKLKRLPVIKAGSAYAATAFVIVQVLGEIADRFELRDSIMQSIIWVSIAGFPIVILLTLLISAHFSTAKLLIITLGVTVVGYLGWAFYWITYVQSPQLEVAVSSDEYAKSWMIAREMDRALPFIPKVREALAALGRPAVIDIKQDGVDVFWQPYGSAEYTWEFLGTSPLDTPSLPVGPIQLRLEKPGYQTAHLSVSNPSLAFQNLPVTLAIEAPRFELTKEGEIPEGMVLVPGGPFLPAISGEVPRPQALSPYYIDKYEVTNRQFKAFIDDGGYTNPRYWQDMNFVHAGRSVGLDEAMAMMVDQTGRQAPAAWELADYADGRDDYPVTGISWYEAQAYAKFKGNILPPMYHWAKAAFPIDEAISPLAPAILPRSNFPGNTLAPVGQFKAYGPYGTLDMAGNAREWVWNIFGGMGLTLGGAVSEPEYTGFKYNPRPRFDRSELTGFRTVRLLNPADMNPFGAPLALPERKPSDFYQPMDDATFEKFAIPYAYSRRTLNAKTAYVDESHDDWIKEKISIEVGYNNERMDVLIFRPKNAFNNLGSVVFYPGLNYFTFPPAIDDIGPGQMGLDYIIKSGRALIWPAVKGSLNRIIDESIAMPATEEQMHQYREMMVKWRIDSGRVLDYLEDRAEFDSENINYLGMSYGAAFTNIVLIFENRFNAAVFLSGGISPYRPPLSDGFLYADRVKKPTLMLNGEQDYLVPLSAQVALFSGLGSNEDDKKYVLYKAGHWPLPRNQMVNEVLNWLDKYKK